MESAPPGPAPSYKLIVAPLQERPAAATAAPGRRRRPAPGGGVAGATDQPPPSPERRPRRPPWPRKVRFAKPCDFGLAPHHQTSIHSHEGARF